MLKLSGEYKYLLVIPHSLLRMQQEISWDEFYPHIFLKLKTPLQFLKVFQQCVLSYKRIFKKVILHFELNKYLKANLKKFKILHFLESAGKE